MHNIKQRKPAGVRLLVIRMKNSRSVNITLIVIETIFMLTYVFHE